MNDLFSGQGGKRPADSRKLSVGQADRNQSRKFMQIIDRQVAALVVATTGVLVAYLAWRYPVFQTTPDPASVLQPVPPQSPKQAPPPLPAALPLPKIPPAGDSSSRFLTVKPNRADTLLVALKEWRSSGVGLSKPSLALLQNLTSADESLFLETDSPIWPELKSAHEILDASRLGYSSATMERLPIYIESEPSTQGDPKLISSVTAALNEAHMHVTSDKSHAAVVLLLSHDYSVYEASSPDYRSTTVTVSIHASYNVTGENLFSGFSIEAPPRVVNPNDPNPGIYNAIIEASVLGARKFVEHVRSLSGR